MGFTTPRRRSGARRDASQETALWGLVCCRAQDKPRLLLGCVYFWCMCASHGADGSQGTTLQESFLSFHLVDRRDGTQVPGLGSKRLYLLSHLFGPLSGVAYLTLACTLCKVQKWVARFCNLSSITCVAEPRFQPTLCLSDAASWPSMFKLH